jgi:hypothetical protein
MSYPRNPGEDDIDLAQFDNEFAEAKVEDRQFGEVPDGNYQVSVERVELTHAKSSGNPMLRWSLRILAPAFAGRLLFRNNVMASPQNVKWLKNDLHICGLDLPKLSELPAHLDRLLDVKLEVTKRTKGDSESVYFNRRIALESVGGKTTAGGHKNDIAF